ncbi:MAG: hypothetical protein FWB96_06320 [Defluviitaleaceae bacterium]|nr:hypothetical protein [Defluviitaleaceae bacterium]MCL2263601.1 hypothetical protein [Defluviitaleaceae bacterium]
MVNESYAVTEDGELPPYDLSTLRKNPYAERLKNGYAIRIIVPPNAEQKHETGDFLIDDNELQRLKEFVASEEKKRQLIKH